MTQEALNLIPNEKVFAPRPPEQAPLWLGRAMRDWQGLFVIGLLLFVVFAA